MEETTQTAAKSASKYYYYVEFSRITTGAYVSTAERISEEIGHVEVSVQGKLYVSSPFRLGSASNEAILRIPLDHISLPLTTSPDIILKLYVHLKQSILLLGVQHLTFKYCRFPLENEFPVLRKHNNQRIYQLHVKLDRSATPPETLWENTYAIGQLTHPGSPAHAGLLLKKAVALPKDDPAAFQNRLFHGIASLCLKKYQGEKTKFFELSAVHRQAYWDEFSTQLMSQNSLLFHAGDSKQKKHVFVDIDNHRVLITGTPSNNSIPQKVSSAAMVQLPNGNYILAGGVECDGGRINYDGLYYYNPRKGAYLKIGELPHYVHKLTLHYHNGHVLLFGGSDPKEDSKPAGSSSEPGTHGSSIYRYSLAKRKWLEQKLSLHHRVNDRVYSYFYKDKLIITRKNGDIEVVGVDLPKDAKSEKNTWASSLFVANLSVFGPATFFVVSGQLYVIHKRANEELKKFRLQKFIFKADKASLTLVEELELNNVSSSYVKAEVCPTTNELTETVYLFEQDDISTIKFTAGVLVKNAKGSPVTKGLLSPQHKEAGILSNNVTNWIDACTSPIRYLDELEHRQQLSTLPTTWSSDSDALLKPVVGGLHHSFWPLVTGQTLVLGYLQRISQDGVPNHQYKLNTEALSIRTNGWGSSEAVLRIPSCALSTIRHGLIQVKSHLFFFGGLESHNSTVLEDQEVNPILKSVPNKLTPTAKILMYTLGTQVWKQVGLLPEHLYGCALAYDELSNKLIVVGGYTSENTLSQKLYMWDLSTFLLEELPVTLDLQTQAGEALEVLHLEGFLYIGTRSSAQTRIINIKERTVTQSECGLFQSRRIYSADRINKLPGSKAEYCFLWTDDSNPNQLKRKRVFTNFSEGGLWIAKQTIDFALESAPESPTEIVDSPYADPVLAQEYSGRDTPSEEAQANLTPEEKEKLAEPEPNKHKIKPSSFAVYDSKADFFGLDELEHSKCYTDYSRENNFAVFSERLCLESSDKSTAGDSLITKYSYTQDKFTVIDAKESTVVGETESKPQYSQGLVSSKFLTNSLQVPLADGSLLVAGGEAAHHKKLVASNQCWLTNLTRGSWSLHTRMAETRSHHTGLRVGKYVYVFGGRRGAAGEVLASCEKLNLATHVWEPMPNLQVPVCMASSVSLFGKIYVIGGETQSGTPTDCIQIYDILTGAFESLAKYQNTLKLAKPLKNLVALTINFNTFFVAGGETKEKKPNMEIYTYEFNHGHNVATPEVTSVALYPHVGAKASIVDATVMIVGGNHFNGVTAYNLREKVPKEITSFRDARSRGLIGWTGDGLAFCESKIEYYIADTYIHSNPKFDKLYIFGMDQRNEVWR